MTARPRSSPSPLSPQALVDEYFIENRTRLLEIAAFLDRLDRAEKIQMLFSDAYVPNWNRREKVGKNGAGRH